MPICNPESFHNEAQWQRVCARCGKGGPFHAHHVVDKATLRNRCHLSGNELYDTRNALRLCENMDVADRRCHLQFENRRVVVTTKMLTQENIEYAFEKLGPYAADYLRGEYDDTDPDPRIVAYEQVTA